MVLWHIKATFHSYCIVHENNFDIFLYLYIQFLTSLCCIYNDLTIFTVLFLLSTSFCYISLYTNSSFACILSYFKSLCFFAQGWIYVLRSLLKHVADVENKIISFCNLGISFFISLNQIIINWGVFNSLWLKFLLIFLIK